MAIAGKVAITPGGEWSVDIAYDKLVVVTFGNNVYLSIKPSTGIEPTNEEYWMLLIENVTQEQYDNIINGTTPVGNANKLGGKGASEFTSYAFLLKSELTYNEENVKTIILDYVNSVSATDRGHSILSADIEFKDGITYSYLISRNGNGYFTLVEFSFYMDTLNIYRYALGTWNKKSNATTADLANYLPKSGGKISGNQYSQLTLEDTAYDVSLVSFRGISGDLGHLGFDGVNYPVVRFADWTSFPLLHSGNVGDYVLPRSGGDLTGRTGIAAPDVTPLVINNTTANAVYSLITFYANSLHCGALGFNGANNPIFYGANGSIKTLLHTGNSAKVAIQESAPTDTSALWYDTVNKICKRYVDGAWQA